MRLSRVSIWRCASRFQMMARPIEIERATVRWVDGYDFGLDFVRLSPLAAEAHHQRIEPADSRLLSRPPEDLLLGRLLPVGHATSVCLTLLPARCYIPISPLDCSHACLALSMLEPQGKIWMDGSFVNWADAHVHVMTHSLHYGLAAFEGHPLLQGKVRFRNFPTTGTCRSVVRFRPYRHDADAFRQEAGRSGHRGDGQGE